MPLPYPLPFGQACKPDSACCALRWFCRSFTRIGLTMSSCFLATIFRLIVFEIFFPLLALMASLKPGEEAFTLASRGEDLLALILPVAHLQGH